MLKKYKSSFNKLSRFKTRLANFFKVFNYVIQRSFKSSKLKHIYVVLSLIAGGALHVFALLQITLLIGNSGNMASVTSYLPKSLSLDNFSISFTSGAILISSTFLIGAIFTYIGESRVLRLATDLEEKLTINLLDLLDIQAGISKIISSGATKTKLYKLLLSSPRLAGRFLRLQFSLIQPLLKSIVLLAVLIFIDLKVTIFILAIIIGLSTVQYSINIRAVKFSRQFDESNIKSKKFLKSKIELAMVNGNSAKSITEDISKNKFFQQNKSDYRRRLQVTQESKLASSITKACIILILLATTTNWGNDLSIPTLKALFSYTLILVFFLISFQVALACITSMNRFYSQVREYVSFVNKDIKSSSATKKTMYISIVSKTGEVNKIFLNDRTRLFIICRQSNPARYHLSLLFSIQIETQNIKQNTINTEESHIEKTGLLPYIVIDEESPAINKLNLIETTDLQIAYIHPNLARKQKDIEVYELFEERRQLIPWPNKMGGEIVDVDNDYDDEV